MLLISPLSSIAFRVFRSNKLQYHSSLLYSDIKQAYFGGIVDVYHPYGKNLYYYDINSLYPYAMLKDMPVGNPTYVEGDIDLDNSFGFFYADIVTPSDIHIPILPVKRDGTMPNRVFLRLIF